jgi:hypothetical protein
MRVLLRAGVPHLLRNGTSVYIEVIYMPRFTKGAITNYFILSGLIIHILVGLELTTYLPIMWQELISVYMYLVSFKYISLIIH